MPATLPMAMDDSTAKSMDESFAQIHNVGMRNLNREEQSAGNIAEQTRLLFLMRAQANDLAQDILDQNSARNQPGQNPTNIPPPVPTTGS